MTKKLDPGIVELIEDCYKEDWRPIEIKEFFEDEYQLSIHYNTILGQRPDIAARKRKRGREYSQRPEVKERKKEYMKNYYQRPEVKERQREHQKKYQQKPEVKARQKAYYQKPEVRDRLTIIKNLANYILEVFDSEILTAEQIRMNLTEQFEVHFPNPKEVEKKIDDVIADMEKDFGEVNSPIVNIGEQEYKLNKKSPYWRVCDGFAEEDIVK